MDAIADLRAQAVHAAARNAYRQPRIMDALAKWTRRRDGYVAATRVLGPNDPMRSRAVLLAEASAWRLSAWQALGEADVTAAVMRLREARLRFRQAMLVGVPS